MEESFVYRRGRKVIDSKVSDGGVKGEGRNVCVCVV